MKNLIRNLLLKIASTESDKLLKIRGIIDLVFLVALGLMLGLFIQPLWLAITLSITVSFLYVTKHMFDLMVERVVIGRSTMNMMTSMIAKMGESMSQSAKELELERETEKEGEHV